MRPVGVDVSMCGREVLSGPTVGVETEEPVDVVSFVFTNYTYTPILPVFLLLVGRDVDKSGRPLQAIGIFQLLEEDLNGLAIGCVLGDEMDAFGILDVGRRLVSVEVVGHCESCLVNELVYWMRVERNGIEIWFSPIHDVCKQAYI